jgi:hypothetical protein
MVSENIGKTLADERACANCASRLEDRHCLKHGIEAMSHRQDADATTNKMKKPNVRGPSPSRKAHLALREALNRKLKQPPPLRAKSLDKARRFRRNEFAQHE